MKPRILAVAGLMVVFTSFPASANHRYPSHGAYGRYSNSPVHTAYGIYPYSYSNPAFRAGGGTVAGTNAVMMQMMVASQMRQAMSQQQAINAQKRAFAHAAHQNAIKSRSSKQRSSGEQDE